MTQISKRGRSDRLNHVGGLWSKNRMHCEASGVNALPNVFPGHGVLTSRERDVLAQIIAGSTNKVGRVPLRHLTAHH